MKKCVLLTVLVCFLLCMLAACDMFSKPTDPVEEDDDSTVDANWTDIPNADAVTVYTHLLKSAQTTLKDVSTESVTATNPTFSLDSTFNIEINSVKYVLTLKVKYNMKKAADLKIAAELVHSTSKKVIIGAYYGTFNETDGANLYIKIYDGQSGKLKFNMANTSSVFEFFPITNFNASSIKDIATILGTVVSTNKNVNSGLITGRTRKNGNVSEYEYSVNIDMAKTIKQLVVMLGGDDSKLNLDTDTLASVEKILKKVLGMSLDELKNGTLPSSTLKVDFKTSAEKIQTFDAVLNVGRITSASSSTSLFGGKSINVGLSMSSLAITKDLSSVSIPFFAKNEHESYKNFINKDGVTTDEISSYGFKCNLDLVTLATAAEDETTGSYTANVEFTLHESDPAQTAVLIEVRNKDRIEANEGETRDVGIYIKSGSLYLYGRKVVDDDVGDYECLAAYNNINVVSIIDSIGAQLSSVTNNKLDTLSVVASLLSALQITEDDITFKLNENFITTFIPSIEDFEFMLSTTVTQVPVGEALDLYEIEMATYIEQHVCDIQIEFIENDPFIYELEDEIEFPEFPESVNPS